MTENYAFFSHKITCQKLGLLKSTPILGIELSQELHLMLVPYHCERSVRELEPQFKGHQPLKLTNAL